MRAQPPTITELGAAIRELREGLNWTQRALGHAAGMSPSLISNLESGEIKNPGVYTLWAIAVALGVSMEDLMGVQSETTRQRMARLRRQSRTRRIESIVKAMELSKAPILFVHANADAGPRCVLIDANVWNQLDDLLPEDGEAAALVMNHDHLEPNG